MLYWNANFQIPNSGNQAAEVFVQITTSTEGITANFFADKVLSHLLFDKTYSYNGANPEEYLLSLPEFQNYSKI